MEDAYAAYDREYRKRVGQDPAKLKQLREAFDAAKKDAQQYVVPNQFTEIAEENGATGINASTGLDSTEYFWSMPANRLRAMGLYGKRAASATRCRASSIRSATW